MYRMYVAMPAHVHTPATLMGPGKWKKILIMSVCKFLYTLTNSAIMRVQERGKTIGVYYY